LSTRKCIVSYLAADTGLDFKTKEGSFMKSGRDRLLANETGFKSGEFASMLVSPVLQRNTLNRPSLECDVYK